MWEYDVRNNKTGECDIFFGYNWNDAVRRMSELWGVDENIIYKDYEVEMETYID